MKARILCIGNRLIQEDSAGPLVHDLLVREPLPRDIQVVEGGIAGLNLLPLLEDTERVVIVDSVHGFHCPGGVVTLEPGSVQTQPERYDHASGLSYLLGVAPRLLGEAMPTVWIVGIEPPTEAGALAEAARRSLDLALSPGAAA